VLLGAFGTSSWCGPDETAPAAQPSPANLVRFAPLSPAGAKVTTNEPWTTINGIRVYEKALLGPISGTVYSAPSLGAELMASGPGAGRVIRSLAPSVRDVVLEGGKAAARTGLWRSVSFAGLDFAVPAGWPVSRTAYAFGCAPTDIAFSAPAVTLDTDTDTARLPCPYIFPPRMGTNGVQIDQGSLGAPNAVTQSGPLLLVNGLRVHVDDAYPFGSLVVEVDLPHQAMPVRVTIGLGTASTAGAVLRSVTAAP
jgi:hypothetical protein